MCAKLVIWNGARLSLARRYHNRYDVQHNRQGGEHDIGQGMHEGIRATAETTDWKKGTMKVDWAKYIKKSHLHILPTAKSCSTALTTNRSSSSGCPSPTNCASAANEQHLKLKQCK